MVATWKPADLIAVLAIVGYFGLIAAQITGEWQSAILLIIGYYFGHSASNTIKLP